MHHTEKKNVANFIIFITTSYLCCCELYQILKRPNSGVLEGMGGVGSFLVEIIPLFNLSHGRKCPFGSLAPPALTLLRRPWSHDITRTKISQHIQRERVGY